MMHPQSKWEGKVWPMGYGGEGEGVRGGGREGERGGGREGERGGGGGGGRV